MCVYGKGMMCVVEVYLVCMCGRGIFGVCVVEDLVCQCPFNMPVMQIGRASFSDRV